ncbi:MAG: UvrD-helicase domain-containing protein [Polyangiaceae bacterium]
MTELNPPQTQAVVHRGGPLLVFAGAGSGKTRVITYRIANLVARENVAPYRILAVTFTNKAAAEMRKRLDSMLGPGVSRDLWVGTFHATCARLLRRYGEPVKVPPNFLIYDSSDQKAVVTRALRELELDERRYPPRGMLSRIHKEKQEGRGPEDMAIDSYMDEAVQKVYERYEAALTAAGALDFEDLILRTLRLLKGTSTEAQELARKFEHVLVDEFQDTNATQYGLLRALSERSRNLCVVGDDDQSIYRWRGADVRNIRGFRKDFPDAEVVKLEQNYRSTSRIVDAALHVVAKSRQREPKELWTENDAGDPILVVETADEREEAGIVLMGIQNARSAGVPLSEVAVFYRVHAQSRVLEEALRAARIGYTIVGGLKFYERAEVKDALAYLRILVNPASDVDALRIINTPPRGIGTTTTDKLQDLALRQKTSFLGALDRLDEPETLPLFAEGKPRFNAGTLKKLVSFRDQLKELAKEAQTLAPHELLDSVLTKTGYRAALEKEDSAEAEARLENIAELRGSIRDYEEEAHARGETPSLLGFLERVSLQSDGDEALQEERVTMMTVHGAKGLEFTQVFLTGMEEDMFPYRGLGDRGNLDADELDEERRLAYVAITRARRNLCITFARSRQIFGSTRWGSPSRFLADIPREHIEARASRGAAERVRFVDRPDYDTSAFGGQGRGRLPTASALPSRPPPPRPSDDDGGRFVDATYFDDTEGEAFRRGSRVKHARFGEGEVREVLSLGEPAVRAFFPGWGEMKVLARFLTPL